MVKCHSFITIKHLIINNIDLNNREKAIFIWGIIFLIWGLTKPYIRKTFAKLLKSFFSRFILLALSSVIVYVLIIHFILHRYYLWDTNLLKDSIYWFFGTAISLFMKSSKAYEERHFFADVFLENMKFVLVLEFIVNFYSFSFVAELFLVPVLFFIVSIRIVNELKFKIKVISKLTEAFLSIIGFIVLGYMIFKGINDYKNLLSTNSVASIVIYPLLTILYLPYVYFFALYLGYVRIFSVIKNALMNKQLTNFAKKNIFYICKFNLKKLNIFHKTSVYKFFDATSLENVTNILDFFKRFWKKYKVLH